VTERTGGGGVYLGEEEDGATAGFSICGVT
jgi:hypothetical protein